MKTKILAIDPGLNITGWCFGISDGRSRARRYVGELHSQSWLSDSAKVRFQTKAFWQLLLELEPDVLGVEQYVYQGKRSHKPWAFHMSRLVGRLEGMALGRGVEVVDEIDKNAANAALGLTGKVTDKMIARALSAALPVDTALEPFKAARASGTTSEHENDAQLVFIATHQRWSSPLYRRTA